jgi:hypothetical protein
VAALLERQQPDVGVLDREQLQQALPDQVICGRRGRATQMSGRKRRS